jgi:Outer membrane protein beta-barrel domain
MKKQMLLMTAMIFLFNVSLLAQKFRFGIQAGSTMSNMSVKVGDIKLPSDMKFGVTAGLLFDMPINEHFIFQPAANFVQKGFNTSDGDHSSHTTLNYIEAPLNFLYRQNSSKGFFAGIGPSIGYGISGKLKDETGEENIHFGSNENEDDLKTMDLGGNVLAGYLFGNGLQVSANYNQSFSNLAIGDAASDIKIKNNYFSVRVGYFFSRKK